MPNLQHDPQNPCDLLGHSIAVGDVVAWATTFGRSPAMSVSKITKIRFIKKVGGKNKEVPQFAAEDYQLYLQPIKTTGMSHDMQNKRSRAVVNHWVYRSWIKDGQIQAGNDEWEPKSSMIQLVKNIVKLNMTEQEAQDAAASYPD